MYTYILLLVMNLVYPHPDCAKSREFLCGDVCVGIGGLCQCGKESIQGYSVLAQRTRRCKPDGQTSTTQESYCCGQNCRQILNTAICVNGKTKKFNEKCDGKCFLEYNDINNTELDYKGRLQIYKIYPSLEFSNPQFLDFHI